MRVRLFQRDTFGCHIAVMKAPKRHAQTLKKIKRRVELELRCGHGLARKPRPLKQITAQGKRVLAAPTKGVPVADRRAQMFSQGFAQHHALGVVPAVGQRVATVRALKAHGIDVVGWAVNAGHGNSFQLNF